MTATATILNLPNKISDLNIFDHTDNYPLFLFFKIIINTENNIK
jgi:hypothetical protein